MAAVLAACGGQTEGAPATGGCELFPIKMGVTPTSTTAAVYAGLREGVFEEHCIDLELQSVQGGAAGMAAVVAGDMQISVGNPLSMMTMADQGLPVVTLSNFAANAETGPTSVGVFVNAGSDIADACDLEGRKFGVNTLKGPNELLMRKWVEDAGCDPDSVQVVEMGFPDMPAALQSGQLDAAMLAEPFLTQAEETGLVFLADIFQLGAPGMPNQILMTTRQFAEAEPDVIENFLAAMDDANSYVSGNEDLVREILVDEVGVDPAIAEKIRLDVYTADLKCETMQTLADLMDSEGWLEAPADVQKIFPNCV